MEIEDHIRHDIRSLIHGAASDPTIIILYCGHLFHDWIFADQIIHGLDGTVDTSVIDDIVRIYCRIVKCFHRYVDRCSAAFIIQVCKDVSCASDIDHLRNIVCTYSNDDLSIGGEIEERNGLFRIFEIIQFLDGIHL